MIVSNTEIEQAKFASYFATYNSCLQKSSGGVLTSYPCYLNQFFFYMCVAPDEMFACPVPLLRLSQLLEGAVVVTLCQNEAYVKCQMDIDSSISLTEQAGKIRLIELTHQWYSINLIAPAFSVSEMWWSMSIGHFTFASFWQRITTTAPFND